METRERRGRYPMPAVPDGWFGVGRSDELAPGEVRALRTLGRDLVLYRGEDGRARLFDAHCPHLGAHLGVGGRVCGDGLRCPFHGWRFDGEGRLVEVPGLARGLPRAALRGHPVRECEGFLLAWHHGGGRAPDWEVVPSREDPSRWTDWISSTHRVRVHVQDLTENILDRGHFGCVHDMAEPEVPHFAIAFDGPRMRVEQRMRVTAVSERGVEIVSVTTSQGPGIAAVDVRQGPLHMVTWIVQTPVDDQITEVGLHFSMERLADAEATRRVCELNQKVTLEQFLKDVPIWEHKVYRERPLLTRADGPIAAYRRWFGRFYSGATQADDG